MTVREEFEMYWKAKNREQGAKEETLPQTPAGSPEWKALKEAIQQKAKGKR